MRRSTSLLAALVLLAGCSAQEIVDGIRGGARVMAARFKDFTPEEELEIGGTVAAQLASAYPVVENPGATEYVNLIAATVSSCSDRPEVMPRVLILQDEIPNAYACPGGYMFVTTGLLKLCQDESELAGILGHEFAHVAKKHSLRGLKKKRTWSCAAGELSKLGPAEVQKFYNGFKGGVNAAIGQVAGNKHGKEAEKEADEAGAEMAVRAGYDADGLARFIGRLPTGEKGRWLEAFSVYKNGDTRGQNIAKYLERQGLGGRSGVRNAERYKRLLAGVY